MRRPSVEVRDHCVRCRLQNVVLVDGDRTVVVACGQMPRDVPAAVDQLNRFLDASDEAPLWGAELRAIADTYVRAVPEGASAVTAAALREAADAPPDCEEAFRFRLCMLLELHPRDDRAELDTIVARSRGRVAS